MHVIGARGLSHNDFASEERGIYFATAHGKGAVYIMREENYYFIFMFLYS
jgi:hypothetical protein